MILFLPGFILIIIGWLIKYKKVTWLISGYNTATKQEKERYDMDKLCKYMGDFIFILSGIWFVMAIARILISEYADIIIWIGFGILAVTIVSGIVYLNTGNRVKKE